MTLHVVYRNPRDYPGMFVLRIWTGMVPEAEPVIVSDDLEEVRRMIPIEFSNIGRFDQDDPAIYEVWI
jgi:hypothetical protein